jgi:hypothetical protein
VLSFLSPISQVLIKEVGDDVGSTSALQDRGATSTVTKRTNEASLNMPYILALILLQREGKIKVLLCMCESSGEIGHFGNIMLPLGNIKLRTSSNTEDTRAHCVSHSRAGLADKDIMTIELSSYPSLEFLSVS